MLEQMKSDPDLSTIPVVVLTTSRHEEDVARTYKLGCNSFINKPLDVVDFIRVLRELGSYWLKLVVLPGRQAM